MASPSGRSSAHSARIPARSSIEADDVREQLSRLEDEAIAQIGELRFQDLGGKDLARPVGKVVRLVDQQDRFAKVLARQVTQRGGRLEDVVVVGNDRVGAVRELELDLEGADLLAPRLFEDDVRVEVGVGVAQASEEVRPLHLLGVALGEAAEVLVAEDPVVGAHPVLGADLDGVKRALVHRHEGRDRHLLLQRLGRQEDDLPAGREALGEGGVERRGRLARARRRLGDQVLAGFARPGGPPRSSFPGRDAGPCAGRGAARPRRPCAAGRPSAPARCRAPGRAAARPRARRLRRRGPAATAPRPSRCRRRPRRPRPGRGPGAARGSSNRGAAVGRARRRSPEGRTPSTERLVDLSSSMSQ